MKPDPQTPFKRSDHLLAIDHPSEPDDPFEQTVREIWNNPTFPDKKEAIDALREAQAEASLPASTEHQVLAPEPEGTALLKLRIPDRDYPLEVLAQAARGFIRNHSAEDYELAVAQAYRYLDALHRISDRHKLERSAGESEPLTPFGKAMMRITGQKRPGSAEKQFVKQMAARGFACLNHNEVKQASGSSSYIDPAGLKQFNAPKVPEGHNPDVRGELKIRKLTKKEIEAALAPFRKNGFSQQHVKRLREWYREIRSRMRSQNAQKATKARREKNPVTGK